MGEPVSGGPEGDVEALRGTLEALYEQHEKAKVRRLAGELLAALSRVPADREDG